MKRAAFVELCSRGVFEPDSQMMADVKFCIFLLSSSGCASRLWQDPKALLIEAWLGAHGIAPGTVESVSEGPNTDSEFYLYCKCGMWKLSQKSECFIECLMNTNNIANAHWPHQIRAWNRYVYIH